MSVDKMCHIIAVIYSSIVRKWQIIDSNMAFFISSLYLFINTSVGAETDNAKLVIDMLLTMLTGRLTFSGLELTIINL